MGLPSEHKGFTWSSANGRGSLRVALVQASALVNTDIQPYHFQCWQLLPFIHDSFPVLQTTADLRILNNFSLSLFSVVSDIQD